MTLSLDIVPAVCTYHIPKSPTEAVTGGRVWLKGSGAVGGG